jgi:hypothetical protein
MTQLHRINKHQISLLCDCGHDRAFSIKELLDRLSSDTTVAKGFGFTGSVGKDKKLDNKQAPL